MPGTVRLWPISVNKLPVWPVSAKKKAPGLTVSRLVISLLSVPPCSASGPLSSILWLPSQTGTHLRVSQGLRKTYKGATVTVTSYHGVNMKKCFCSGRPGKKMMNHSYAVCKLFKHFLTRANSASSFLKGTRRDHELTTSTKRPL